ncbi:transcription factor bHLH95-like [Primulina huaijiensis]|uniref:transcription factor bHLH95-like n=1 Tax=Primulina huaijiensis TaxID=1492673 RepID=UPI003CC766B8
MNNTAFIAMLAMVKLHGSHDDSLSWDDEQEWSFPNLGTNDSQNCEKKSVETSNNSDGQKPATHNEEAPPTAKGRKRSSTSSKGGTGGGDKEDDNENGCRESEHELHIWTERERRKKMRNMFSNLHALLPQLPVKADKSTIVDEAINYIRKMQRTLQNLEKQKVQKLQHGITNPTTYDPFKINRQNLGFIQSREAFLADQGQGPATRNSAVTISNPNIRSPMLLSGSQFPAFFKTWTSPNVTLSVCGEDAHISLCGPRKPGLLTAICFVMEKYGMEVVAALVSSDANRCMYMFHAHTNINMAGYDQFPGEEICKQAAAEILAWLI